MDVNLDVRGWLTADQIATLRLPDVPKSGKRVHECADRAGWEKRLVDSAGRTGNRREYRLPEALVRVAEARLQGESMGAQKNRPVLHLQRGGAVPPSSAPTGKAGPLDEALLQACLAACASACGEKFQSSDVAHQVRYAGELYNLLGRLFAAGARDRSAAIGYAALSEDDLVALLRIAQKAGWIRNYVKPLPPLPSPQGGGRFLHK